MNGGVRTLIVGGGVAGLVAARERARAGDTVTVIEAHSSLGGTVAAESVAGITLDIGAESFATRGNRVRPLLDELGLTDRIVRPEPSGAWLRRSDGRSFPLPATGIVGIPADPLASDVRAAIGLPAALRASADRVLPRARIAADTTLGEVVRRRMGNTVLRTLVAPVTRGVYSSDPDELVAENVIPGLRAALDDAGSLAGAIASLRGTARPGSPVESLRGGMHTLVSALAADIRARGGEIITGQSVTRCTPAAEEGWSVHLGSGNSLAATQLICAAPEKVAHRLLSPHLAAPWPEPADQQLDIELITIVVDAPELGTHPRGSGVLIADGGAGVAAKALTHSTAKWRWLAEQTSAEHPGRHVVRLSYGRRGEAAATLALGNDAALALAVRDAGAILGVRLNPQLVVGWARTRYPALPTGSADREQNEQRFSALANLQVTGAWVAGTGLAAVIPHAVSAAAQLSPGIRPPAPTSGAAFSVAPPSQRSPRV